MPDGTAYLTIEDEDYERIPKSEEEIQEEIDLVNERIAMAGVPPGSFEWEPDPYRPAVFGLFMDGDGHIWARLGYYREIVFEIFDTDGNHVASGDRHRGVGFDQLAEIRTGTGADADLIFWNADGSFSAACGNATRCIARFLMDETGRTALDLRTVLQRVLFEALKNVGGERGSIVVLDDSGRTVDATIVFGSQVQDNTWFPICVLSCNNNRSTRQPIVAGSNAYSHGSC